MPRQARITASTGIYHIMIRGINKQVIFEDTEDEEKFLELLSKYKKRCGFLLLGYCLMDNHVHLLLKEAVNPSIETIKGRDHIVGPGEPIKTILKKIGISYAYYFNLKYNRTGHLFQDRYRSEPVENEAYLLIVLRYIHQNPVKAGLCKRPEQYSRSSYNDYFCENDNTITETQCILEILPRETLKEFTDSENDDKCIDMVYEEAVPKTDREASEFLYRMANCRSSADFQQLSIHDRDFCLKMLRQEGFGVKQICRVTGCSRMIVYRSLNK